MTFARSSISFAVLSGAAMTTPTWAAADDQHDSHHPAPTILVVSPYLFASDSSFLIGVGPKS